MKAEICAEFRMNGGHLMWIRVLLDGLLMSAVFNTVTALLGVIDPAIFTTSYPKPIQKIVKPNPKAKKYKLLFGGLVIAPLILYGAISAYISGIRGFWNLFLAGYAEWFLVNLGDFFGLDIYYREKMGDRLVLPGTEGHWCYTRKGWMKSLALMEHFVEWPFIVCPLFALIATGIAELLQRV